MESLNDAILAGHFEHPKIDGKIDVVTNDDAMVNTSCTEDVHQNIAQADDEYKENVDSPSTTQKLKVDKLLQIIGGNKQIEVHKPNENANHLEPDEKVHNETYCKNWIQKSEHTEHIGYEPLQSISEKAQDDFDSTASVQENVSSKSDSDFLDISSAQNLKHQSAVKKQTRKKAVLSTLSNNPKSAENPKTNNTMYVFYNWLTNRYHSFFTTFSLNVRTILISAILLQQETIEVR